MENSESCPSCQTNTPLQKTWLLNRTKGRGKTEIVTFRIFLYKCPKCGRSFRKAKKEK